MRFQNFKNQLSLEVTEDYMLPMELSRKECLQCAEQRVRIFHMVQSAEKQSTYIWKANQLITELQQDCTAKTAEISNLSDRIESMKAIHLKENESLRAESEFRKQIN